MGGNGPKKKCLWLSVAQWVAGRWPVYGEAVVQLPPRHTTMVWLESWQGDNCCRPVQGQVQAQIDRDGSELVLVYDGSAG